MPLKSINQENIIKYIKLKEMIFIIKKQLTKISNFWICIWLDHMQKKKKNSLETATQKYRYKYTNYVIH